MRKDVSGWDIPWDEQRAETFIRNGDWSNQTMHDHATALVAARPDHIIAVDREFRLSATEMYRKARALAGAFASRGLKPGERISYQLPNWYEAIIIDLAATIAGLIVNPLVPIYREAEVGFMMDEIGSRMIFVPEVFRGHDYAAMMKKILPALSAPCEVVVVRGGAENFISFDDLVAGGDPEMPPAAVAPDDVKLVLYTSGTSGRAKGVLHSHNTVGAMADQFRRHMRIGGTDALLVSSPVTHITGAMLAFILPWVTGARAVMMDIWNGERAVTLIRDEAVSVTNGAAPFISDLIDGARATGDRLPSLRVFVAGGSGIPEALAKSAYDELDNCVLFRAYGATEVPTTTLGSLDRADIRLNISTDGRPVYTELKIVDLATGAALPAGAEGEILMRGPQRMLGYLRTEDNAGAFDDQGYFRSGDLGRFVEDDWIEITGRAKDIIIRAGENLSPKEIEDALIAHPAVKAIAIVAKPSPRTGEEACAFVVPQPGASPTLADFASFLIARGFAKQKIPEHLILVDALPTTAAGKVQKHLLRKSLQEKAAKHL